MCDAEKRAVNARVIRWRPRPFWGESAVENGEGVRGDISSFEVLDHLLDLYAGSHVLPALEEVVVWGFSAGGQMINGYTAASEVHAVLERRGLRVRYVIMSPSNFLHFSSDRVLPGTDDAFGPVPASVWDTSPRFDHWGRGLVEMERYPARVGASELIARFAAREIHLVCGAEDDDPDHPSLSRNVEWGAQLQGDSRLSRARIY